MLRLDRTEFTCGRSVYLDFWEGAPEPTAKIFVKIRLRGRVLSTVYAQVDTGAPWSWSVLDPRTAALLGLLHPTLGNRTRLDTRLGRMEGALVRIPVQFPADHGEDLEAEGTFFVSPHWPTGRTFLGYSGLLDSMRFALDPQANHFYFGS